MLRKRTRHVVLTATLLLSLLTLSCAVAKVDKGIYEIGEVGKLRVFNPTQQYMAVGRPGCTNFVLRFQIRRPGRWTPDPLMRLACVDVGIQGLHTLDDYRLIRPGASIEIEFPTHWVEEDPTILRVLQHVSVGCERPRRSGAPIRCSEFTTVTTDPFIVVAPGTTESQARS